MAKLATARECRSYGPWLARNRWEYINAGLYVFAVILLLAGFCSQLSGESKSGLSTLLFSLVLITAVNVHDLFAHLAGIDFRLALMVYDKQLALVEVAVPVVISLGSILNFLGFLFVFIQTEKGYSSRYQRAALNLLIAGPALWVCGSIHNACQIYERADGHVQILQKCVQIPFLMGSLLFLVGGILNRHAHGGLRTLSIEWIWLGICGSLLFLVGGLLNVVKIFEMHQMDGLRLEKLRGGAQERLLQGREGQVPLILEEQRRRKKRIEEAPPVAAPTSYKDVLIGHS